MFVCGIIFRNAYTWKCAEKRRLDFELRTRARTAPTPYYTNVTTIMCQATTPIAWSETRETLCCEYQSKKFAHLARYHLYSYQGWRECRCIHRNVSFIEIMPYHDLYERAYLFCSKTDNLKIENLLYHHHHHHLHTWRPQDRKINKDFIKSSGKNIEEKAYKKHYRRSIVLLLKHLVVSKSHRSKLISHDI